MPIDGGAVEASWVVRTPDGRAIGSCECADPAIARVRIVLEGVSAEVKGQRPCDGRSACEFACQRQTGATPFDIPPGTYAISLTPTDAAGQDLLEAAAGRNPVRAPAPILREVVRGQPTQLETHLLVAPCAQACSGDSQGKACR